MSILDAIEERELIRSSISGRGGLHFTRGTKNQVSRKQRDDCADASDRNWVADLLETDIFINRLDSISGFTKKRSRRVRRYNQLAILHGLPLKKRRRQSSPLLLTLAIEELNRPRRIARPFDHTRDTPRTVATYSNQELGKRQMNHVVVSIALLLTTTFFQNFPPPFPCLPRRLVVVLCIVHTRVEKFYHFKREHLVRFISIIDVPETVRTRKGSRWAGEAAVLFFLRRMFAPRCDMDDPNVQKEFGRQTGCLSEVFNYMVTWFEEKYGWLLDGADIKRWAPALRASAAAIASKVKTLLGKDYNREVFGLICMFLDGFSLRLARPTGNYMLQQAAYDGHNHYHGGHCLAVVLSNGIVPWFWGIGSGRNGDLCSLRDSGLEAILRVVFDEAGEMDGTHYVYTSYADRIFFNSTCIRRSHRGLLTDEKEKENAALNPPRTSIEWTFGKTVTQVCQILGNEKAMKIRTCPVYKIVRCAIVLLNVHTCFHGCETGTYFGTSAPDAEDYLNGVVLY